MKRLILLLLWASPALAVCTKPVISSAIVTPDASGTFATFTWTTSVAADSSVTIGIGDVGPVTPDADLGGVTSHTVVVNGLHPGTVYGWGVRSRAIDSGTPCDYHYYTFFAGSAALVTFNTPAAPAGTFDYFMDWVGPLHVTQGYNAYELLEIGNLVGSTGSNTVKVVVSGLPNNVSVAWSDSSYFGQAGTVSTTTVTGDTFKFFTFQNAEVVILTNQGGTTTPGTYTITATGSAVTTGPPTHTATFSLTVDSTPFGSAFPYASPTSYPAIPQLATFLASAATYGAVNCAQDLDASPRTIRANNNANLTPVGGAVQKGSWYYDGVRVYYNVSALLNDYPTWEQCRTNIKEVYRDDYIIPNSGAVPAFTMFPQGYYIDYLRTGEAADLTLMNGLDAHTFTASHGSMVSPRLLQRETAYALKIDTYATKMGVTQNRLTKPTSFWLPYHLDHVLGQVDQICYSQNPQYWESFMAGLQADALIDYYVDVSPDPRIPPAIKCLADFMYANAWNNITDDANAFQYDPVRGTWNVSPTNSPASSSVPLNLLVAPMYAWLFKLSGSSTYQTEGDLIWQHGVLFDGAGGGIPNNIGTPNGPPNGNSGKIYSQQYYWGPSYVTWRSNGPLGVSSITGTLSQGAKIQ